MPDNKEYSKLIQEVSGLVVKGDEDLANDIFIDVVSHGRAIPFELKLKSAIWFSYSNPYMDLAIAQTLINEMLSENPGDFRTLIMKARFEYLHWGSISKETFDLLKGFKDHTAAYYENLPYLLCLYYYYADEYEKYVHHLKESTQVDKLAVDNYKFLARYYYANVDDELAVSNMEKALSNVKFIINRDNNVDWSDFQVMLDAEFRGVIIAEPNYVELCAEFDSMKNNSVSKL